MHLEAVREKYLKRQEKAKVGGPTYLACNTVLLLLSENTESEKVVDKLLYYANHTKNGKTYKEVYREAVADIRA